ncbi:EpsG family protein [Chitinophaga sp. sic0106]|uniref:EpsG family protein n=1 Tax=Chitinophaga sp. sic0106 TaxID=2854785 RepID=UPI001C44F187|nr:EpsG family protein [Chitinophaga sp. sic0106]MBV7528999.1 EpsG family protein [Chitinophaga sp. sic0106]
MEKTIDISKIQLSLLITLMWMAFPVLTSFLILYLFYKVEVKGLSLAFLSLLIALTFGLIAYTAKSVSLDEPTDITRYTAQFNMFTQIRNFQDFVITVFVTDSGVYLVFESVMLMLAKLFPTNPQVVPLFWVSVSYFFLALTSLELAKFNGEVSKNTFLILLILVLFGTSLFTMEVELLKQSSATGIAAFAIAKKINGKKYSWWLFVLALLVHTSVIIFVPLMIVGKSRYINRYFLAVLAFCSLLSLIDLNKILGLFGGVLGEKASFYSEISNWQITKINYFLFGVFSLFVIIIILVAVSVKHTTVQTRTLFNVIIISYCLLLIQYSSIHNFVRYVNLYSPFYVICFFFILNSPIRRYERKVLVLGYLIMMVTVNLLYTNMYLHSDYTNAYMENSVSRIMTSNVYSFLTYRVNN